MAVSSNAARHAMRLRAPGNQQLGHGRDVRQGMGHAPPPPPPPGGHGGNQGPGGRFHFGGQPNPPIRRDHLPDFRGDHGQQNGQTGGWQGLQGIFQMLSNGGVNASQLANLGKGYTGGNGYAVGNAHDAFSGLSPYAAHWLATSGVLQQAAPQLQDTTGLTGDALWQANMMNQLKQSQAANSPYTLHSGVTQDMLSQMLGMTQGGGYAKGYNAQGRLNPMNGQPFAPGGGQGFMPPHPR